MNAIGERAFTELSRIADECYVGKRGDENYVVLRFGDGFIPATKNSNGWILQRPVNSLDDISDLSLERVPRGFVVIS